MPPLKTTVAAQLAVACLLPLSGPVRADGGTVPYDRALGVIQASEQALKKSKWVARATYGRLSEPDNEGARRTPETDSSFEAKVHSDPARGKYRCDVSSTEKWVGGPSPYIKHSYMKSFDGKIERNYDKGVPSDRPPTAGDLPGELVIEPEKADRLLSTWGWPTGIGSCPPYFANVKVSELVKNTVRVRGSVLIRETSPEVWLIRVQDPSAPTMAYNLTYDLGKGGLVTAATWEAYDPALDKRVFGRYTTELGRTKDGHYYPKTMQFDHPVDKRYRRVDLSEFEYGSPYDDSVYVLDCPPGTKVLDKINRKFYIIGGGPTSDRDLTIEFIRREGLGGTDEEWERQSASGRWRKFALGAAVLASVLAVAFVLARRHRLRSAASRAALVAILAVAGAGRVAAAPPGPVGFTEKAHGHSVYVSQCGFNAIVFALHYCGRPEYDIDAICRCLDVNDEGIPFRQLRDVLQAHGLFAEVREDVDLADLPDHLGRHQLAILPIRFDRGNNHYIVLIKHPTKGLLVVDPPRWVVRLDATPSFRDRLAEMRKPLKSAALFVRGDAKAVRAAGAPRPDVSPAVIDLGPVTVKTSPTNKTLSCQVTNAGDRAMMVTGVSVPCGCMSTDWTAAVIPAGGAKTLTMTVDLARWGPPNVVAPSKDVYLDVLGQPPLKLTVAADLANPANRFRHLLDKDTHKFRLADATPAALAAVSTLSANEPIVPGDYTVASAPAWMQVGLTAAAPDAVRLAFTLVPAKLPPLDAADALDGMVQIEDKKHRLTHTIRVAVDRSFTLDAPTPLVTLHTAKSKVHEITLSVPAGSAIDPSGVEVSGDRSLSARIVAREPAARRLRCALEAPGAASRPEYHTVNFIYKTAFGPVRARLRVLVAP
jgi:hypothetical protein